MHSNKTASHLTWANYYTPCDPEILEEEMCLRKGEAYHRPRLPSPPLPEQEYTPSAVKKIHTLLANIFNAFLF